MDDETSKRCKFGTSMLLGERCRLGFSWESTSLLGDQHGAHRHTRQMPALWPRRGYPSRTHTGMSMRLLCTTHTLAKGLHDR